ncbi:MAG: ABC transporter permease [Thermomicrobiales bacterium]|nr:ABC transporter permease [Thermomicrobiales bacterium]
MGTFLARRALRMVVILLLASIAVFYSLRFAPGDPTGAALSPTALEAAREAFRERLGLNRPVTEQYVIYLSNLARGDLGSSMITGKPIGELLTYYGRNSLVLGLAAFAISYLVAIPLGVLAAARRNTIVDQIASGLAILGMGMPNFWLALLLITLFSAKLRWLPSAGCCSTKQLILPAVVLAAEGTAVTMRMMRSSMLDQLGADFVRTHRAKGLREITIVGSRVFRNALLPVISLAGLRIGWLIGYSLIVETIFQWPGVGYLLVDAILRRDYPVAQFFSLLLVAAVVLGNFLADLAYGWADPRIRRA